MYGLHLGYNVVMTNCTTVTMVTYLPFYPATYSHSIENGNLPTQIKLTNEIKGEELLH